MAMYGRDSLLFPCYSLLFPVIPCYFPFIFDRCPDFTGLCCTFCILPAPLYRDLQGMPGRLTPRSSGMTLVPNISTPASIGVKRSITQPMPIAS
jgi:hypothetical protein